MGDVDNLDSANLVKVQDLKITKRDPSPFWENFTWRFAESRYIQLCLKRCCTGFVVCELVRDFVKLKKVLYKLCCMFAS
jgi:hypothetical protein